VLLDELGSGTDPEEGAAIAASVIEHLLEIGALLVVTTHLSALKSFAVNDTRIVNASMEFDSATGQPTYRLISGIPGRSRAIEVAQIIGLPDSVIRNARERLGERYGETDHLLATLQKKMSELVAQQDELAQRNRDLESDRKSMQEKSAALEKERLRLGTTYREELERLRDDVARQVTNEIKSLRDMDRNARATVNANEVLRTITKPVDRAMEFIPAEQRECASARRPSIASSSDGEVVSIDGEKAVLNVNGRKMTVERRDLVPKGGPAPQPLPAAAGRRERRRHRADDRRGAEPDRSTRRRRARRIGQVPRPRIARRQAGRAHHPRLRHRHAAQGGARASAQTSRRASRGGRGRRMKGWATVATIAVLEASESRVSTRRRASQVL
jgi:dsDNA-specific endonuclease/ATPase MutS2